MLPKERILSGSWPVMVTPFGRNLSLDRGAYRAMISWYMAHDVGGLYANCLSSEMYALDDKERVELSAECVATVNGRVPVAATGNLGPSIEAHIALCRRMADSGVDIVMLTIPPFLEDDELERYFFTIAEKIDKPLGLYECPVPKRRHLSVSLVRKLAQSGRFVAYKETSCDLDKIQSLIAVTRGTPLSLLQANVPYLLEATRAGAPGTMSVASICFPELVAAVIHTAQSDPSRAERLHGALCAMHLAQRVAHPAGSKYLLSKRGLNFPTACREQHALPPEVLAGLDYAAQHWFDAQGNLRILKELQGSP